MKFHAGKPGSRNYLLSSKYWAYFLNQKHDVGWFLLRRFVDLIRLYSLLIISRNHSNTFFFLFYVQINRSKVKNRSSDVMILTGLDKLLLTTYCLILIPMCNFEWFEQPFIFVSSKAPFAKFPLLSYDGKNVLTKNSFQKCRSSRLETSFRSSCPEIHRKTPVFQVFSCECCQISKNTISYRTPLVAACCSSK